MFCGYPRGKEGSDLLELELQAVVGCLTWVLRPKLGSSVRAALLLTAETSRKLVVVIF